MKRVQEAEQKFVADHALHNVKWWMVDASDPYRINARLLHWFRSQDPDGQGLSQILHMGAGSLVWIDENVCQGYQVYAATRSVAELVREAKEVFKMH